MSFDLMNLEVSLISNYLTLENCMATMSLVTILLLIWLCRKKQFTKLAIVAISLNTVSLIGFIVLKFLNFL